MEFENETDSSQDKLDVEYRQILRIIKPYIQTINNNAYLSQYRIWLEKLSGTKDNEKFVRNQYLMELARQIQCKHLASPFSQNPPRGELPPLKTNNQWEFEEFDQIPDETYVNKQKMCQQWTDDNDCKLQWPYHAQMRRKQTNPEQQMREAQRCVKRSATSVKKLNLLKEIDELTENVEDSRSPTRASRPPTTKEIDPKKHLQSFTSLGVIHEDKMDLNDESWGEVSDISDISLAVLGSGDNEKKQKGEHFEKKINTLMIEINGLKRKSERVNEKCEHALRSVQEETSPIDESKDGIERKKSTEKETCFITTDWKKIVESLQVRLSETQTQNRELNALTSTLHKKIKEIDASKEQTKQEIKKQLMEQQNKEIDSLNALHANEIKDIESSYETKIKIIEADFEKRRQELEASYEDKIKEIEIKYVKNIEEKNAEINRLEEIIQKKCSRLVHEITVLRSQIEDASHTNTSNDERILFLQKCITKMDRLFQKSEREYCKQIEKLKQELDNRDKAIQIQLQTQKAEIIARCSVEKQSEMDGIVQNLESKYSHLLDVQQQQLYIMKNEDEKVINELRAVLDRHNIPY